MSYRDDHFAEYYPYYAKSLQEKIDAPYLHTGEPPPLERKTKQRYVELRLRELSGYGTYWIYGRVWSRATDAMIYAAERCASIHGMALDARGVAELALKFARRHHFPGATERCILSTLGVHETWRNERHELVWARESREGEYIKYDIAEYSKLAPVYCAACGRYICLRPLKEGWSYPVDEQRAVMRDVRGSMSGWPRHWWHSRVREVGFKHPVLVCRRTACHDACAKWPLEVRKLAARIRGEKQTKELVRVALAAHQLRVEAYRHAKEQRQRAADQPSTPIADGAVITATASARRPYRGRTA